ncbi:MAG: sigma-54-dependent Fis family transcriptional regulator [Deltaproteobacteria bacterium]|nr:MAG: sigma-54-dependent Fis family transcriptional regulator [Deltaproteobacteria bacterium]
MDDALLQLDTLDHASLHAEARPLRVTLTVLAHPSASRVGEVWQASGQGTVLVSRAEPGFRPPGARREQPLLTPLLSRKPLALEVGARRVALDTSQTTTPIRVDGHPVTERSEVGPAALERGVVLELGRHVVLLLHLAGPIPEAPGDDLGIVGHSDGTQALREAIARAAQNRLPLLVRGETGSGKELVAAAVHALGASKGGPYVAVNLAALAPNLIASELFGHARGAFSGAAQAHDGYFVRAHGGTLLLDEIGEAPVEVQVALLRVLETQEVQPIGGRAARRVDVRVIAATDADLDAAIASGRFRAPLFYRLGQQVLHVPPLRERRADIGRLIVHFLRPALAAIGREALLEPAPTERHVWLSADVVAAFARAAWPGNIRELRNAAQALAALSDKPLRLDDPEVARLVPAAAPRPAPATATPLPTPEVDWREISADELHALMARVDYKLGDAADALGVSRPTINKLVDEHPVLRRPATLSRDEIEAGLARAEQRGEPVWKVLEVSERGLRRRMVQLGFE